MKSGNLRQRVTIQQPTLVPDGMGGGTYSWSDVITVWANVTTLSASSGFNTEDFVTDQFRTTQHFVVKMRFGTAVTTQMRLSFKNRILEILSIVTKDELRWETHLFCREGG